MPPTNYIRWFQELRNSDVAVVGGKNASLGELYGQLAAEGIAVPNGFALTIEAYFDALEQAQAIPRLHDVLDSLNVRDVNALAAASAAARQIVHAAIDSAELRTQIGAAYQRLEAEYGPGVPVAVRSSATAEDLPTASFAGQHDSFLNVSGKEQLVEACRHCFASLFTDRALAYRCDNGFDHFKVGLSVGVMKLVRSDEASAGVIFTCDPETGFRDAVMVTASYGLGENIVQGEVDPDEFCVHKPTLRLGFKPIIARSLGAKQHRLGFARLFSETTTRNFRTPDPLRAHFCISDDEVLKLASMALRIEEHYSALAGHPTSMDIEWAKDGEDGALYVVQARPLTAADRSDKLFVETYQLRGAGEVLLKGKPVGSKIASGKVRVIESAVGLKAFEPNEVLVAKATSPHWQPAMRNAAAIVTDLGGRTCHAAIVARELGVPAVVGTGAATSTLETGNEVTVSCSDAETGFVYAGSLPFDVKRIPINEGPPTRTEIMVNLGDPAAAFAAALLPLAGVGLARIEFVIGDHIGIHPMALIHPERVGSAKERTQIAQETASAPSGAEFFVQKLAEGVGKIAAAFYPRPVIVRLSDFKTNEYAKLLGGSAFEAPEPNPMLGFRGAFRYAHPAYAEGFALECRALKRVRDEMGMSNVRIMVPFCRTVAEARHVVESLAEHGLKRGKSGTPIFMMCEIPNNVMQIDEFAKIFDGFSIGSNDLTQLILGVDRDSEIVASEFDERDPGVLAMLRLAVDGAKRNGKHISICGEAPADFPEIAQYLVTLGIDAISVNPGSVPRLIDEVRSAERLSAALRSKPQSRNSSHRPTAAAPATH